jgi:hypothetical protein
MADCEQDQLTSTLSYSSSPTSSTANQSDFIDQQDDEASRLPPNKKKSSLSISSPFMSYEDVYTTNAPRPASSFEEFWERKRSSSSAEIHIEHFGGNAQMRGGLKSPRNGFLTAAPPRLSNLARVSSLSRVARLSSLSSRSSEAGTDLPETKMSFSKKISKRFSITSLSWRSSRGKDKDAEHKDDDDDDDE